MEAARAARRKERILASSSDRMARVGGEAPSMGREKRLVLDDEEMDPSLARHSLVPAPIAAAVTDDPIPSSSSISSSPTDVSVALDADVLLDALLDEVFKNADEDPAMPEMTDEATAKATRKRPARRKGCFP
jgi:hypothetical protein